MTIVDQAMQIAINAHFGQRNKHDNEPYLLHCHRVSMIVRDEGGDDIAQAAAWLHDVLEDTDVAFSDILAFNTDVAVPVAILTKNVGEPNEDYYHRVRQHPVARIVKLADLADNFGRNHLIMDEATRLRMAKKYSLGMDILKRPVLS